MTVHLYIRYVKSMRHKGFWALLATVAAPRLGAQRIPARDLLEFPLGSLAEAPALSLASGDGFRNPASIMLGTRTTARFSVSSLSTRSEQGVAGQVVAAAISAPRGISAGLSVARASVDGIVRTDLNPQSIGNDVPYAIVVVSAMAARRQAKNVTAGVALRYQSGELDSERRATVGIDAGAIIETLFGVDGRLGLTSFLWRPGTSSGDGPAFAGAFDLRVFGRDSLAQARAGYSYNDAPGISHEHYWSATGRLGRWEGRAGVARITVASGVTNRGRLAVGFHYSRYSVGVSREETPGTLAPVYHFTFVASVPPVSP